MGLYSNKSSQVRVGVRIRPLTPKESGEGGKSALAVAQSKEIRLGERRFTYDVVFEPTVSQSELYQDVSTPLRTSFLEGYNATVRMMLYVVFGKKEWSTHSYFFL